MPSIITKNQSAFAKNRLITNNILITFDTLHYMRNHNSGSEGFMVLKLDMSEAYGRVEWAYLEEIIRRMFSCDRWIDLIMVCVKIVSFLVLVNGEPQGLIHPSRGIRKGDPLSPFIFLLCTEGLLGFIT